MCELRSAIFSTEVNIMDEAMTEILQKDCKKWTKRERYTVLTEYIFVMYDEIKDGECSERRVSYFTEGSMISTRTRSTRGFVPYCYNMTNGTPNDDDSSII